MTAWTANYGAEALVLDLLAERCARSPALARFAAATSAGAGTRLLDWVDHIVLAPGERARFEAALGAGYVRAADGASAHCPGALLPPLVAAPGGRAAVALRTESIDAFARAHGLALAADGVAGGAYRSARAWCDEGNAVLLVERRWSRTFVPDGDAAFAARVEAARTRWAARARTPVDEQAGMASVSALATALAADVGPAAAAWAAMAVERDVWQARNAAARVQRLRQDRFGLGWANHDHHTFRSSRGAFATLIAALEALGFVCRERFYAGADAGWGAQVLEQPDAGLVIFADVDLDEREIDIDFAHAPLPERERLGTIGLWCALHGESLLGAGMHHLEASYDFDRACAGLEAQGVRVMAPFVDLPYLRQAFTVGERWPVAPERLARLRATNAIDAAQAEAFARDGSIGSHFEVLERRGGYKGFHSKGVSSIIAATDPRRFATA